MTANQINSNWRFKKKKCWSACHTRSNWNLLYFTPSHAKSRLMYTLKHYLVQKVHAQLYSIFLFSSIIITKYYQHVNFHLLPVLEIGKSDTLALNFGDWPFDGWPLNFGSWPVTRYFRPKSGYTNERVCRKPIDKRLKALLKEGSGSFLWPATEPVLLFFG